jgi:hypothetical protein
MMRRPWRGQGVARGIHDELMRQRHEQRTALTVDKEHPKVRALYQTWGYVKVAGIQSAPDSPLYDSMVLDLAH